MQMLYNSIALGALGLAFGLTLLIKPLLESVVFALLYAAIALSTWYCTSKKSQLIADKKKRELEDKLRHNQEKLAILDTCTNSATIGFAFINQQHRYARINNALCEIYHINAAENLGKTITETLRPELAAIVDARVGQVLQTQQPILNVEEIGQYNESSSKQVCYISNYYPVCSDLGEILGVGIAVLDITERKQTEIALAQSEEIFRELAENIQDVFWVFNPIEKQFLYVSPAYEKISGCSVENLYANYMEWCEPIHPYDQARVGTVCFIEELKDGFNEEYRVIRPDGSIRWIRDRGVSLKDSESQIYRVVGIAEDITEQKQAQEIIDQLNQKLQRRISELQTLFNVIPIAIAIAKDYNCHNIRVNAAFAQILDIHPQANASSTPAKNSPLPLFKVYRQGKLLPDAQLPLQYACKNGVEVADAEIDILRDDGVVFNLYGYASPLYDEQGNTRGAVGAFIDISKRKQVEVQRKQLLDQKRAAREAG